MCTTCSCSSHNVLVINKSGGALTKASHIIPAVTG